MRMTCILRRAEQKGCSKYRFLFFFARVLNERYSFFCSQFQANIMEKPPLVMNDGSFATIESLIVSIDRCGDASDEQHGHAVSTTKTAGNDRYSARRDCAKFVRAAFKLFLVWQLIRPDESTFLYASAEKCSWSGLLAGGESSRTRGLRACTYVHTRG